MSDEIEKRITHWQASNLEATGVWAERRRLASAMRRVIDRLVVIDAPEDEVALAADRLEQYASHLETHPVSAKYAGFAETSPAGDTAAFFDQSPLIGLANPLAPPVTLQADPDRRNVHGSVNFGSAYEGPPGCVHGGFVAAAFDEVLGFANSLSGTPGMTANLSVRYRKPTPLHTELRFEARYDRSEGRKIWCSGDLYADDLLTASAEGLFIAIDPEKFRGLYEQRLRQHRERET